MDNINIPTGRVYSCEEVAARLRLPVNEVRQWASSHYVTFSGTVYIFSQNDFDNISSETNYGNNRTNHTAEDEIARLSYLNYRASKVKPSSDPSVNRYREAKQFRRSQQIKRLRERKEQKEMGKGCLYFVIGFIVFWIIIGSI